MTTTSAIPTPTADEYHPFYAGYIAGVADEEIRYLLDRQVAAIRVSAASLSQERAQHRYEPGKWSVKEVLGHLADAERIFAYRALRILRGDTTPLPGFDENRFVEAADFDEVPLEELVETLGEVRKATIRLLERVPDDGWEGRTEVNGGAMSLRAIAHVIAGHMQHHLRILRDRYGVPVAVPGRDVPPDPAAPLEPRISFLTLGVDDLERAVAFYRDGLGLPTRGIIGTEFEHGAVAFFQLRGGITLALWPRASIANEVGLLTAPAAATELMVAQNVRSPEEVAGILDRAIAAGATLLKPAAATFWGGYAGYFQDPDGHVWEIAWNPKFRVDP